MDDSWPCDCDKVFSRLTDNDAGCAHAQQLIWQLFNAVEKGAEAAGESDKNFLDGQFLFMCGDP